MTGAFSSNPIPTLILEGRWDLTWGEKKKDILKNNHPHGEMVVFEQAAHGIYDEDPEQFFSVLKNFVKTLPKNVCSKSIRGTSPDFSGDIPDSMKKEYPS